MPGIRRVDVGKRRTPREELEIIRKLLGVPEGGDVVAAVCALKERCEMMKREEKILWEMMEEYQRQIVKVSAELQKYRELCAEALRDDGALESRLLDFNKRPRIQATTTEDSAVAPLEERSDEEGEK